jgi:hypothetical protein
LVVSKEVDLLVKEDREQADYQCGKDKAVSHIRALVELSGLDEKASERDASEDVSAELVVAGVGEVVEAVVRLVLISFQH